MQLFVNGYLVLESMGNPTVSSVMENVLEFVGAPTRSDVTQLTFSDTSRYMRISVSANEPYGNSVESNRHAVELLRKEFWGEPACMSLSKSYFKLLSFALLLVSYDEVLECKVRRGMSEGFEIRVECPDQ